MSDVPPFRPLPDFFGDAVSDPSASDAVARDPRGMAHDPAVEAAGAADPHALAVDSAADIADDVAHPDGQMQRVMRYRWPVAAAALGLLAFAILAATRSVFTNALALEVVAAVDGDLGDLHATRSTVLEGTR